MLHAACAVPRQFALSFSLAAVLPQAGALNALATARNPLIKVPHLVPNVYGVGLTGSI